MVSKKNSQRGFVGCDAPVIPRARRSIRKKVSCKKTGGEPQLCPFELLATVAGKLLQEAETSASASSSAAAVGLDRLGSGKDHQFIKKEIEGQPLLAEQDDQGSSEESVVSSGRHSVKKFSGNDAEKVTVQNQNASIIDSSACTLKMAYSDLKSGNKIDGRGSLKCDYYSEAKSVDNGITAVMRESAVGYDHDDIISATNKSRAKDGIDGLRKRKRSVMKIDTNEDANIIFEKVALGRGSMIPDASFLTDRNDAKTGSSIYEDEILSQFFCQSNSKMKAQQRSQNPGGGRMTSGSKNWSSCPKLKDLEGTNSGSMVNNIDMSKKLCLSHERFELHDTPPKTRKLFNPSSVVTHDCGVSSESVSNSTRKGLCDNKSNPGIGMQSPSMERQRSFTSRNSPVKLSIKSFEVPELVIEVAESTTVGSLKKTILEAVARVFGEGLSVGLLHNGKRIYDDDKSLSEEDNLDNLGFLLEPNNNTTNLRSQTQPPPEDSTSLPISDNSVKENVVNRSQLTPKVEANLLETLEKRPVVSKTAVEGDNRELVPFVPPPPEKEEKCGSDSSRAVVPVVENVEALAVVGLVDQKPKRSEMGQRRTRRPFSVSEVEALVQAVEKLGTGRWRDVKLSAFENAKHRTYVDLKDKWKTLVHTSRISPQQRRGEPVPQELLDRVLAAHAYWSQYQAKQHGKQQQQIHHHHHHHQTPSLPIEKVAAA